MLLLIIKIEIFNHIDIATGILTASLNLTRIDNIEKEELSLLRDSCTSVRQGQQMPRQNWGKIEPNGRRIGC
jgi:hypothetical protein